MDNVEGIYRIVGILVVWIGVIVSMVSIFRLCFSILFDVVGEVFDKSVLIVEYFINKRAYMAWKEDKKNGVELKNSVAEIAERLYQLNVGSSATRQDIDDIIMLRKLSSAKE